MKSPKGKGGKVINSEYIALGIRGEKVSKKKLKGGKTWKGGQADRELKLFNYPLGDAWSGVGAIERLRKKVRGIGGGAEANVSTQGETAKSRRGDAATMRGEMKEA